MDGNIRALRITWQGKSMTDILHIDLNCFFAAVEVLDNPSLEGLPVVVGGRSNRSVVSSASYEARVRGVHAAMPIYQALRCCPNAILLPVRMDRYRFFSNKFMKILESITPLVESVSLDEAYLDVSHAHTLFGDSFTVAHKIIDDVFSTTGLRCTIGISHNKLLAKLASKAAKPKISNGKIQYRQPVVRITQEETIEFLSTQSVSSLPGIGHKTLNKLTSMGVGSVADLKMLSLESLTHKFGYSQGSWIFDLARGKSSSEVIPCRLRKSVGREETFDSDVIGLKELSIKIDALAEEVYFAAKRMQVIARCVSVKIRFTNFETITRSKTKESYFFSINELKSAVHELLAKLDLKLSIRLCGVQLSHLSSASDAKFIQHHLFEDTTAGMESTSLEDTALKIKERFGNQYIRYGLTRD